MIAFATEGRCDFCGSSFEDTDAKGFEIHEIADGEWRVACIPCSHALELNEGK